MQLLLLRPAHPALHALTVCGSGRLRTLTHAHMHAHTHTHAHAHALTGAAWALGCAAHGHARHSVRHPVALVLQDCEAGDRGGSTPQEAKEGALGGGCRGQGWGRALGLAQSQPCWLQFHWGTTHIIWE